MNTICKLNRYRKEMPRLRSLISIILVLVTTLLVSCGSPQATVPPTYTAQKIEQLQVYVTPISEARDQMSELGNLIARKQWMDAQSLIHGPLGQLRQEMANLSRNLLPKDQKPALDVAKELFTHFNRIDAAAKDRDAERAITQFREALKDFDAFLDMLP